MAKDLTTTISNQITNKDVKYTIIFKVNGVDRTSYLQSWDYSFDAKFGASTGNFTLINPDGIFFDGGSLALHVGDTVELICKYTGDASEFKKFYGFIDKRSYTKGAGGNTVNCSCLDYIGRLNHLDIDLTVEGNRVKVINEVLDPVYLAAPNDSLAQVFNFANDSIATEPPPNIIIRDKDYERRDTQYDGYEILYGQGQLKLGSVLNVQDNYDVLSTYFHYTEGVYAEDIIQAILTAEDGYGNYLFGETSAANVIANHLIETFNNVTGKATDVMTYNTSSQDIEILHDLDGEYDPDGGTPTQLTLVSVSGLPTSGTGEVNGDIFTWTGITSNTLTGIPTTGDYALSYHPDGAKMKWEDTYGIGQVWSLSFSNVTSNLVSGDFTIPGGTFRYFDKRFGRILLDSAISIGASVYCSNNYSFNTLQATGIELNQMKFRKRETANRFEAVKKVRDYLAPNYIIRTIGDNKIWSSYLRQKSTEDYTLTLSSKLNYLEDDDLYTRVHMYAKNSNPTNLMLGDGIDYESDTESSYTGIASNEELLYIGDEKSGVLSEDANNSLSGVESVFSTTYLSDLVIHLNKEYIEKDSASQGSTGYRIYSSPVSGQGKIILGTITPRVFLNGVPVDNKVHQQAGMPIKVKSTKTTITSGGGKSKEVSSNTYYAYSIIFAHTSIDPNSPLYLYDAQGILQFTISPGDGNMDYARGILAVDGLDQNSTIEGLSTATYFVLYAEDSIEIDYENVTFKIKSSLIPDPDLFTVSATFEYWAIAVAVKDIDLIVDGRRSTQFQMSFYGQPPQGFHLATLDLGQVQNIQAIDIVGGFFKPDDYRRFDMSFQLSMTYSSNGVDFYEIGAKTSNFKVESGKAVSLEEEELGSNFEARYLRFSLGEVTKITYGKGVYVVAITEVSIYSDIVVESMCTLIPYTQTTQATSQPDTTVYVGDTTSFASSGTAYIDLVDAFTYTGKTATTLTGVTFDGGYAGDLSGTRVTQTLSNDTSFYDVDGLLPYLGDRVKKEQKIKDNVLYSKAQLDRIAKAYLEEYYKNHSKVSVAGAYSPYLEIGQTLLVVDSVNGVNTRYFLEKVKGNGQQVTLTLGRYPAIDF